MYPVPDTVETKRSERIPSHRQLRNAVLDAEKKVNGTPRVWDGCKGAGCDDCCCGSSPIIRRSDSTHFDASEALTIPGVLEVVVIPTGMWPLLAKTTGLLIQVKKPL